eukprot:3470368-Prymnesium_polylepis.3
MAEGEAPTIPTAGTGSLVGILVEPTGRAFIERPRTAKVAVIITATLQTEREERGALADAISGFPSSYTLAV